jgi:Ca-activated chloride channel family protein
MRRYFINARRQSTLLLVALVAVYWLHSLSNANVRAQDTPVNITPRVPDLNSTGRADRAGLNIHVNSDLVLIPVMVMDNKDRMITGLTREQFRLWDEKTEQVISHFAAEDVPVSISLLFDASGSMGTKLAESRAAVMAFIKAANPDDEFSLIQFNDRPELLQRFTSRTEDIEDRLRVIQAKGRTALLDAIVLSLAEMRHAKHRRKAILILSDGGDNDSRYTLREVKSRLRESDVQIYSIGIMESPSNRYVTLEEMAGAALLDDVARQTGGRLFEVGNLNDLSDIATRIGGALRNQYLLGYVPSNNMRDGKYHRVQVKIARGKELPRLRASFRTGYLARTN